MTFKEINNINSLEQLVVHDQFFKHYTNKILASCNIKDTSLVDDIVNDMYLKMHKAFLKDKTISGGYIIITIKNIILNLIKFNERYTKPKQFDDDEDNYMYIKLTIPETIDESNDIIEEKENDEILYQIMEQRINELHWYDKAILEKQKEMSLYQLSKISGIPYRRLIYSKNKIYDKLGIKKK